MSRPVCAVAASLVLLTSLVEAREAKPQSLKCDAAPITDANPAVMSLLQQSYDISQQLLLPVRLNLLVSQAQIAVQFRLDVGRLWVDELFTLSSQMKGRQRSAAQNAAARMLVRLDPHRALELLHSLKIEDPSP